MDTSKIIITSIFFGATTLTTLRAVLDFGETSFKGRIKGIFIVLLINFIFFFLFYIFAITKFYFGFIVVIPIFLFINTIGDSKNFDGY